jgi:tetratricopeptide (TPR) repeat protein
MLDDAEALYRRALAIREKAIPFRSEVEESRKSLSKVLALKQPEVAAPQKEAHKEAQSQTGPNRSESQSSEDANFWCSNSTSYGSVKKHVTEFVGKSTGTNVRAIPLGPHDSSTCLDPVPESMALTGDSLILSDAINEAKLEADLIRQVSGGDDPQLANCLTKLADLLCRSRRYDEMQLLLEEALAIRENRYGTRNHLVATSLKNLARLHYFQENFDVAVPLFEKALMIRRQVYGDNHHKVAELLEQYAKLLRKMNKRGAAEALCS